MLGLPIEIGSAKLIIDCVLMTTLLLLSMKIVRSPVSGRAMRKLEGLEQTLRSLVKDADASSRGLTEELRGHQADLRKLLVEIETAEIRLNRSLSAVENTVREAERVRVEPTASILPNQSAPPIKHYQSTTPSSGTRLEPERITEFAASPQRSHTPLEFLLDPIEAPQPPRFETAVKTKAPPVLRAPPQRASATSAQVPASNNSAPRNSSSLSRQLEKTIDKPSSSQSSLEASLVDVYDAAERLLKAGGDLRSVATETNLPIEQVRVISQLIKSSRPEDTFPDEPDPRLGALTGRRS